jgi:hypothetical protein
VQKGVWGVLELGTLTALLGQVQGVLGTPFLFSGLFPATVFLVGWEWFRSRGAGVRILIESLVGDPGEAGWVVIKTTVLLVLLGLALFSLRGVFISFIQGLPSRSLAWMRQTLIGWQLVRKRRRQQVEEEHLCSLTALRWALDEFREPARYIAPDVFEQSQEDALVHSRTARRHLIENAANPRDSSVATSSRVVVAVVHGLSAIYASAARAPESPSTQAEILEWKGVMRESNTKVVLRMVRDMQFRRWVQAFDRLRWFPQSLWIQPTAIGNCLAVLDDYGEQRYGIDTGTLWARLWGLLPSEDRKDVADARLSFEVLVNLTMVVAVLALLAACALVWPSITAPGPQASSTQPHSSTQHEGARGERSSGVSAKSGEVVPLDKTAPESVPATARSNAPNPIQSPMALKTRAGALLALLVLGAAFYQGSIYACRHLAQTVMRIVDLRRRDLLRAMGFDSPMTVDDELKLFRSLKGFLTRAIPLDPAQKLQPLS